MNTVGGLSTQVFAGADHAASKAADRRSVSGGIVIRESACVSWFSATQKCVTLSTAGAENVKLADAMREALFLRQVWRFVLPSVCVPCIPVFAQNQSAVQPAQNHVTNSNPKHMNVRHHLLRELIAVVTKELAIIQALSPFQHADFLTKAISRGLF